MKNQLKNKINILVLDNHCDERHLKSRFQGVGYHIFPLVDFDKYFDTAMQELASSFGKNGYIGLPLNFIEVLLLISAKRLGVKFYFEPRFDYSLLDKSLISLVFDASGGGLPNIKQGAPAEQEIEIQIPNITMNFEYAGIHNQPVKEIHPNGKVMFTLKKDRHYHYPYFKNNNLFVPMMKLTQVPSIKAKSNEIC